MEGRVNIRCMFYTGLVIIRNGLYLSLGRLDKGHDPEARTMKLKEAA
jgi:hypothetical protein